MTIDVVAAMTRITIGSLFAGIGGLELGLEWAGLGPVLWQVEADAFCQGVLAKHWPTARRYRDVRGVEAKDLEPVDLICGGFPCQDVSTAGCGAGLTGARSGLWREFARLVRELRPRWVVVENVAGGKRRWLPTVRRDLHLLGYHTTAYALSAADVGAPHLRRRVFVVANVDDGATRPAPNTNGERQLEPKRPKPEGWRWSRRGDGWTIEPPVSGVAHGIPHRLDRERALGNAVVPQCGEVIGRIIAFTESTKWQLTSP